MIARKAMHREKSLCIVYSVEGYFVFAPLSCLCCGWPGLYPMSSVHSPQPPLVTQPHSGVKSILTPRTSRPLIGLPEPTVLIIGQQEGDCHWQNASRVKVFQTVGKRWWALGRAVLLHISVSLLGVWWVWGGARAGDQALAGAGKVWPLPGLATAASLHVTLATGAGKRSQRLALSTLSVTRPS